MAKNRHILHAAARRRGNSSRAAVLIAALAVLAGATAAVQPAQAQTTIDICERTPDVEEAILAHVNVTEPNCMIIPQAQLDTVLILFIATASTTLENGDFANLPNLEELDIAFNALISLPEGLFDGLSNLQRLFLGSNNLTSVPAELFDGLSNLEVLLLDDNRLTSLPAGLFDDLSNLEELDMSFNDLISLPEGLFDGLPNLEELGMSFNDLISLPEGLFDDLSNLEVLLLDDNRLTSLPAGLFANLPNLEELDIAFNDLISLPEGLFDGLSNLQRLFLGSNNLTSVPAELFDGLSNLQRLFLDFNSLTSLPAGLFNDVLDTLTELTLDDALRTTVSIEPSTATIALNGIQTFTAQLTLPSPATVRLTIIASGDEAGNVTLPDPATVTIPAGMTSADFDITLTGATEGNTGIVALSTPVLIYTDTNGEERENTAVVNSLVNASTETSTFTVAEALLVATLTRNSTSTEEGASPTPGIFTLALSNAPDGLSTVTYMLAVSGDNTDPAISAEFGGDAVGIPDTSGASDIFTMTITDGDASATLTITPEDDDDATDEVVTLTIINIEFAGSSIGPDDIQGTDVSNGALAITISDNDPTATYDLEDSTASEPTSSTATDATTATFTITLSRLNTARMNSPNRRFFFRVDPNGIGDRDLMTPGYGTPTMSIGSNNLASNTDFTLSLEYQLESGPSVVEFTFHNTGTADGTFSSNATIPKAAGSTEEVYRFHIIPTYDGDDEGAERVLFGYRVHFSGQDPHRLTGVVNDSAGARAAIIRERGDAVRLRIRTFLEGALQ